MKNISRLLRCGRFLLVVFCLFISTNPLHAQWVQTNGPYGASVSSFAVSGQSIYVGTFGNEFGMFGDGVFVSTDDGAHWTAANTGLEGGSDISVLAINGANLFASTESGVFRSTNNGASWSPVDTGPTNTHVTAFAVAGSSFFAGTTGGILLSTNGGSSWTPVVDSGLTNTVVRNLVVHDENMFAGTDRGLFFSSNAGSSWTPVDTGVIYGPVNALAVTGTNLVVALNGSGVFRSTDGGSTWISANLGLESVTVHAFAVNGADLFAGTWSGVFHSTDNGASWAPVNSGMTNIEVLSLAVVGTNLLAGTAGSGVFLSTDFGADWRPVNEGLKYTPISSLALRGTDLIAGTRGSGIFLSANQGAGWIALNTGLPNSYAGLAITASAEFGGHLFAGGAGSYFGPEGGLYRLLDSDMTWTNVKFSALDQDVLSLIVNDSSLIVGTDLDFVGPFLSSDSASWTDLRLGSTRAFAVRKDNAGETTLFAGTTYHGVFRSTDNGTHWLDANSGLPGGACCFAMCGSMLYVGEEDEVHRGGVFHWSDSGANWSAVNEGLTNSNVLSLAASGRSLFAGTAGGVYLTTDAGATWTPVNLGMTDSVAFVLLASSTDLFAGTRSGVWKRPLSEMTTSVQFSSKPTAQEYRLEQNYPNPFNPSTNIKFELPKASQVSLTVFDILGRHVSVLVNERREAGVHEVQFNGSGMASGVYLYRLTAGSFVQTRKLLLLK